MKKIGRRIFLTLAVVGLFAMSLPSCVVRARVRPVHVVDERPPPPRYTTVRHRQGYVWVRGRWVRRHNRWVWTAGHYKRARVGYRWQPGRWEARGGRWHWVAGHWTGGATAAPARGHVRDHRAPAAAPARGHVRDHRAPVVTAYPTAPPRAPRYVRVAPRPGYVWVQGRYHWRGGRYVWTAGHWQRAKAGHVWQAGHWERRGNRHVWVSGRWVAGRGNVRDHRRRSTPPPRGRNENVPARRGN